MVKIHKSGAMLLLLITILLQVITVVEGQTCAKVEEPCGFNDEELECCNEGNGVTCVTPEYGVGNSKCRVCAFNGSSCESRTECCSNCCNDNVCLENWGAN